MVLGVFALKSTHWKSVSDLRVRYDDQDLLVGFEFLFEPDARLQVQVVGGLVHEEQMRLEKEGSRQSHAHPPTSRKVLTLFVHHGLGESQTLQDVAGLELGRVGSNLVQTVVHL